MQALRDAITNLAPLECQKPQQIVHMTWSSARCGWSGKCFATLPSCAFKKTLRRGGVGGCCWRVLCWQQSRQHACLHVRHVCAARVWSLDRRPLSISHWSKLLTAGRRGEMWPTPPSTRAHIFN
eukprot:237396-Chlamydomonas_euryale.AAC.11